MDIRQDVDRVLVTGADGFIGSHLTEYLLSMGVRVRALALYNSFNYWGYLEEFYRDYPDSLEVVTGDIRDASLCMKMAEGVDVVFNLAALIPIPYSYIAPQSYVDVNVKGTLNMLLAARDAGVRRFVQISTSEVYGTAQYTPIDERHPLNPQSPYAATKVASDKLALSFFYSFGLPVVVARPFNTYGPRQSARAVIPTVILQALESDTILLGDVSTYRDFNFVADTVKGMVAAGMCDEFIGREVNIGSGQSYQIKEMVDLVGELLGKRIDIQQDTRRIRPQNSEVRLLLCDSSLLRQATGWSPEVGFRDGLALTIDWFKRHRSRYKADIYNV